MTLTVPEGVEISEEELLELEEWISDDEGAAVDDDFDDPNAENQMVAEKFRQVVVVDGLPVIPEAKIEKLKSFLTKMYSQFCQVLEINMPSQNGGSLGFAFIVLETAEFAASAVTHTHNFQFDAKHKLKVFPYNDLDKYGKWPDKFVAPEDPGFKAPPNFMSWLEDEAGRDQYIIRQDKNTEIYWCEGIQMGGEGTLVYGGEREKSNGKIWCSGYTQWSPLGTYLATFHTPGIALWGGPDFQKINRYAHTDVRYLQFSPKENFMITWNGKDNNKDPRALVVWDVKTGRELRGFKVTPDSQWPIMKWSHDDKYFSRITTDGISVFETSTMKMVNKKPVRAKGIRSFDWSPSDNMLAYWAPEVDNMPARVVIMDPTTRTEIRSKNLFNVSNVKLHWQDAGDFLCAQVLRHSKSKKTTFTNLEIFRMRDANIPNEMVEIKETVEHFSWEPKRERFGMIHGEQQHRYNISFYTMGKIQKGEKLEKLYTLENKQANELHWSPAGNYVILAGMNNINGQLEFWDVDENMSTAEEEHFMCNQISWDPSGRILATVVTQPMDGQVAVRYQLENGYNLWTFQGASLKKVQTQNFYQFNWRPRPNTILTTEEREEIVKNLRRYTQRFKDLDAKRRGIKDAAANAERVEQLSEFRSLMDARHQQFLEECAQRYELGMWEQDEEDEYEEIEETFEELIKETVENYVG